MRAFEDTEQSENLILSLSKDEVRAPVAQGNDK